MSTAIYLKKVKIQAANSLTYYNENERRKHMASNGRYERGKEEGEEGIATDDRGEGNGRMKIETRWKQPALNTLPTRLCFIFLCKLIIMHAQFAIKYLIETEGRHTLAGMTNCVSPQTKEKISTLYRWKFLDHHIVRESI